jgi:hypothetical protein
MGFLAKFWGVDLAKLKKSIRNNALRIALVEALIRASECELSEICSCDGCVGLTHLSQFIGLDFPISGGKGLLHLDPTLIGSKETDALGVLSTQHKFQQFQYDNIFSGFMEFPEGAYPAYAYFQEHREDGYWIDRSSIKRQAVYILVSLALPDSYLNHFVDEVGDQNKTAWELFCETFKLIDMPIPQLPESITSGIVRGGFWTKHFGAQGCWSPVAGYGIEFAKLGQDTGESISLKEYVDLWPSLPDFFTWSDRSNYQTYGGFLVRSNGLLLSQQWGFDSTPNVSYMSTFNNLMAPILNTPPTSDFDHVIVVYSTYRADAYLASKDPRSWDPNTPSDRVLLPLPDGYGLVGNWNCSDTSYIPRSLDSLDADAYTPRLRIAAQYLSECLRIEQMLRDSNTE